MLDSFNRSLQVMKILGKQTLYAGEGFTQRARSYGRRQRRQLSSAAWRGSRPLKSCDVPLIHNERTGGI